VDAVETVATLPEAELQIEVVVAAVGVDHIQVAAVVQVLSLSVMLQLYLLAVHIIV
jgi:hypothetical protein